MPASKPSDNNNNHSQKEQTQPTYNFTFSPALSPWNRSPQECLARNATQPWDGLATASLVFQSPSTSSSPGSVEERILLVQRAPTDSLPLKWELPGGAVDDTDRTVLHGAARELFEETGLVARHFAHLLTPGPAAGGQMEEVFSNRAKTKTFARYTFQVEVESSAAVTLDAAEHCDFAWVTEGEVVEGRTGDGRLLDFTKEGVRRVCLEAFRGRKKKGREVL